MNSLPIPMAACGTQPAVPHPWLWWRCSRHLRASFPGLFIVSAILALGAGGFLRAQDVTSVQSWTSSDGRVIQAKFVKVEGESVVIEKGGKRFSVPFSKLEPGSVALAKKLSLPPPPEGFVLIPAGEFTMGDAFEGQNGDAPLHKVNVSSFLMAKHEVTKEQWDEVLAWALKHGYTSDRLSAAGGKGGNHPVTDVTWDDAVQWCNAKSEKEGLVPCYYNDAAQKAICRGYASLNNATVKWSANGYRLPTEAEWEKAARGGLSGKRFPWGDTISHHEANFENSGREPYQTGTLGSHPSYQTGGPPFTSPVGSFAANGYGLHDVAGNVWEWCWDWYGDYPSELQTDPRGPESGSGQYPGRVLRSGRWNKGANLCCVACRYQFGTSVKGDSFGFRLARNCN